MDSIYLTEELFAELVEQVKHPKVVAVGECGLDYHWDTSPVDLQKEVFIRQIKLAQEVNKPLVIHTRESIADTLEILKDQEICLNIYKDLRIVMVLAMMIYIMHLKI